MKPKSTEIFIPGPAGRLEGKYYKNPKFGSPVAIVLQPHPQYGGTMNNKIVQTTYNIFLENGFSVIRINFRGVGKSDGVFDNGQGELSDAAAALDWIERENLDYSQCWVSGFSFGALICMQLIMRRPEVNNFIAISPQPNVYDFSFLAPCPTSGQVIYSDGDELVTKESIDELDKRIKSQKGIEVIFTKIKGANHFFKNKEQDLAKEIEKYIKEPSWMLDWRLKAFKRLKTLKEPNWQKPKYPKIDYQDLYYYSAPKSSSNKPKSLDEIDPKIIETYKKLGIPLVEQQRLNGIAVDAVFDSVSVATTFKEELTKKGIIFCSISEAIQKHPDLVKKYIGSVIPLSDHYFATLNSAVFTDGSFVYIPPNTRCPMELSTYFRINASETGQFERTLIIADKGSYVSYLEGCTAPMRDENQLHAANVELIALDDAEIKYSTVQNWYPGDKDGVGGIYNFVTKRGICKGKNSKISWTQVETGSAITWKYPSCILQGDNSVGEFYSIAITNNHQKADTGTKMIHLGKNTKSKIISKGISAGLADNTYRGLVDINEKATNSRNYTQCDSLLMGNKCGAHTVPYIKNKNSTSTIEHEATTTKINEEQLYYCNQRGLDQEEAVSLIVNGFCKEVLQQLPMEFAVEAQKLVAISLEGSVG